jgi:hypothetical protein
MCAGLARVQTLNVTDEADSLSARARGRLAHRFGGMSAVFFGSAGVANCRSPLLGTYESLLLLVQ